MVLWGVVFLVALASASASRLAFPEDVNDGSMSRIVSGWEAEEGQFPYQLSIRMVSPIGGVSSCGGTIIHEEWGLTAAHCTATRVSFMVRAGVVNLTTPFYLFEATEYYNHPEYVDELQQIVQTNDIALLKFGRALVFSDLVQPIRLQSSVDMNKDYSGLVLDASGWGRTWTNGDSPENLNWVFLRGVSNFLCRLTFGGSNIIVDSTICAGFYNVSSQSTCQGDSGGPLTIVDVDGRVSQVGVTSFVSATGCHTDIPAGFIRPGFYHDWFRTVTGIDFDWVPETTTTEAATTTEADTTEAASTTEADTTEAATTEEAATTTEAANTEAASTEVAATTEAANTEAASTEVAATTEAASTEGVATTEAANTEAASTEVAATTEAASTEGVATTEAANTEAASTEVAATTEAANTEAASTEGAATTEAANTEAASTEGAATTEAANTEAVATEAATTTVADSAEEEEITEVAENFFSRYFHRFW